MCWLPKLDWVSWRLSLVLSWHLTYWPSINRCCFSFYPVVSITLSHPGHLNISLAGRYNKYARDLPQTPWIIDGERKLESSVEELISDHLLTVFKAESKCCSIHILSILWFMHRFLKGDGKISKFCKFRGSHVLSSSDLGWVWAKGTRISFLFLKDCSFLGQFKTTETPSREHTKLWPRDTSASASFWEYEEIKTQLPHPVFVQER